LNFVSNPTTHAVDFWLDSILGGYITEFAVDCIQSYSVAERDFFKGPRREVLEIIRYMDKMLLCENHMMIMESDC
jgi:hypothetical protein